MSDKLEKELIRACNNANGQVHSRLGFLDCVWRKKEQPVVISLSTGFPGSPHIKVESGISHVEMFNIKSISSVTVPNRIKILNEGGNIIHVRPDIGLITFNGDVKGAIA